ncbi:MAG TPA: M20 family metallopeptidase [Gaiellaceae bacterium]|nr:M20 family metallopeptidase [Gaiellaceae bacterium]
MLRLLQELVELESPTGDTEAMRERLTLELTELGFAIERDGAGIRAERAGDGTPLLLLAHLDTVWERGTLEHMPWRVEDGRAYGPGAYDMKAGIVVMLEALRRSETTRALRVVCTADEEIGSPDGRRLLAAAASGAAAALVVEPPGADGHLKTARKGIGRFRFTVTGRPAHSSTPEHGASAIDALARLTLRLHALAEPERGITLNVGVVAGGTRENVVAAEAYADVDVRIATAADRDRLDAALRALEPETPGTSLELSGSWTRPPLERSPGAVRLFEAARGHGRTLGLDLQETSAPGGSDGNLVGALGVPVLDGLGAPGAGAHARHEHVDVASLEPRAELLARLLQASGL